MTFACELLETTSVCDVNTYFLKNSILVSLDFGCVISVDQFSANLLIPTKLKMQEHAVYLLNLSECDLSCPVSAKPSESVLTVAQYCSRCVTNALKRKTFFRQHITVKVSIFEYVMQICVILECIILIQIGCSTDSTY